MEGRQHRMLGSTRPSLMAIFDGIDIPMDVETVVQRVASSAGSTEHDHAFTEARLVGMQDAEDG